MPAPPLLLLPLPLSPPPLPRSSQDPAARLPQPLPHSGEGWRDRSCPTFQHSFSPLPAGRRQPPPLPARPPGAARPPAAWRQRAAAACPRCPAAAAATAAATAAGVSKPPSICGGKISTTHRSCGSTSSSSTSSTPGSRRRLPSRGAAAWPGLASGTAATPTRSDTSTAKRWTAPPTPWRPATGPGWRNRGCPGPPPSRDSDGRRGLGPALRPRVWGVRRRGAAAGRGDGIQLRGGHRGTPVPPASLSPAGRDKEGAPCSRGGSEREVGSGLRCCGRGPRAGTLQGTPRSGLAWGGRDRGTAGAASSRTRQSVGGRAAAEHVGGSGTASVAARSRERGGRRGRAPLRPAPLRCLPGRPSSLQLPALPGSPQRCCRAGRTQSVWCSHKVKIMRALGGGGRQSGKSGVRVLLVWMGLVEKIG